VLLNKEKTQEVTKTEQKCSTTKLIQINRIVKMKDKILNVERKGT
jgi:hypothetical protein